MVLSLWHRDFSVVFEFWANFVAEVEIWNKSSDSDSLRRRLGKAISCGSYDGACSNFHGQTKKSASLSSQSVKVCTILNFTEHKSHWMTMFAALVHPSSPTFRPNDDVHVFISPFSVSVRLPESERQVHMQEINKSVNSVPNSMGIQHSTDFL